MSQAEWREALLLALSAWSSAAYAARRWLTQPVPGRSLRRYRPGRHHIEPPPPPEPDPMQERHTAALHRMADRMAPHYTLRG